MKNNSQASIGAKIRRLRLGNDWAQAEVARRLKIPASTYREWERGRKIPAEALILIARLYEISASDVLGSKQDANEELAKAIEYMNVASLHLKNALAKL